MSVLLNWNVARRVKGPASATAHLVFAGPRTKWVQSHRTDRKTTGHQQQKTSLTMSDEQAAHHLLNVLEERGLDVDLDKILLGFEDEDTRGEAAAWVHEYLNEETLLTKEELEL